MNIFIASSIFYDELGQRAVIKLATHLGRTNNQTTPQGKTKLFANVIFRKSKADQPKKCIFFIMLGHLQKNLPLLSTK